ncbi:MAG: branched-chain amino acid ABC transporter permease [Actinomycetota bacterium]
MPTPTVVKRPVSPFTVAKICLGLVVATVVAAGAWSTLTMPAGQRLSAEVWRELIALGISQGAVYALIALGYSLVYGILLMINFAHGEVFMVGAFTSFFFARVLDTRGLLDDSPILSIAILFLVSISASTGVAVLLERVAYRPLRGSSRLAPLITAIGASLFLQYTALGFWGPQTRGYPQPDVLKGDVTILGFRFGGAQVLTIVVATISMLALGYFVSKTKTGKAMRATAQDREIAALMGIRVDRVISTTFAVGGIMAGIAGVLFALVFGQVSFQMGFFPGIKAFTAAVLGGIGSISGAALGGLLLGLLESVFPFLLLRGFDVPSPNQLKDVIAFSILVLVLIFRPGGLLGRDDVEKV